MSVMLHRGAWWWAVLIASCSFDADYRGTQYICKLERCPSGYVCIDELCVAGASDAAVDGAAADGGGDVPVFDASLPDGGERPTCDEQFSDLEDYELCSETSTTCRFNVDANQTSCDDVCALSGGTCLEAVDADAGSPCIDSGATTCDALHDSVTCTCTR